MGNKKQTEDPKLFDRQKSNVLESSDLSRKGNVDKDIRDLLEKMNSNKNYFSLSSCSGRIIILRQQTQSKGTVEVNKKKGCDWILVSHDPVDPDAAWKLLEDAVLNKIPETEEVTEPEIVTEPEEDLHSEVSESRTGIVTLKFEPFILHVQCRDVEFAKAMHTQSIESGFRNSGLTLGKSGKIVLAVRSTHGLEVPMTDPENGQLLVDENYLRFVIKLANEKLAENLKRIHVFEEKCSKHIWDISS